MSKLNQIGDTIVEVLICVAIVGAALGAAYVSANRSLRGDQSSKERGQALATAESQIEQLRNQPAGFVSGVLTGQTFCFDGASNKQNTTTTPPASSVGDPLTAYGPCQNGFFHYYMTYDHAQNDLFTVYVRWLASGSKQVNELKQYYRLHP